MESWNQQSFNCNVINWSINQFVNTGTSLRHMDSKAAQKQAWRSTSLGKRLTRSRWPYIPCELVFSILNLLETTPSYRCSWRATKARLRRRPCPTRPLPWRSPCWKPRLSDRCWEAVECEIFLLGHSLFLQVVRKFATPLRKADPNLWTFSLPPISWSRFVKS